MVLNSPMAQLKESSAAPFASLFHHNRDFCKFGYSARSFSEHNHRFKLVGQSLGDKWKLSDINASEYYFLYVMFQRKFIFCFCFEFLGIFIDEVNQSVLLVSMINNIKSGRTLAKFYWKKTFKSYSRKRQ